MSLRTRVTRMRENAEVNAANCSASYGLRIHPPLHRYRAAVLVLTACPGPARRSSLPSWIQCSHHRHQLTSFLVVYLRRPCRQPLLDDPGPLAVITKLDDVATNKSSLRDARRLPSNTSVRTCGHILDLWCRRLRATTFRHSASEANRSSFLTNHGK